jgi:hypothetical protein
MIKKLKCIILFLCVFIGKEAFTQSEPPNLKLSVQTDLLAYTTPGGYSAWLSAEHKRHKLSIAFVNYPNRFRDKYDETGIKETPRWLRFQLSRKFFKPTSKFKNLHFGLNVEHHWRQLEEDNNPDEILNDTHWELGVFAGYDWQPWKNKENALRNIFLTPWVGGNYLPTNTEMARVFENTASIYKIPNPLRLTVGINIGYTFYQN